jgi:hypothetical protein
MITMEYVRIYLCCAVQAKCIGIGPTEEHALKNVSNCWNSNISFYLETSGGQNFIINAVPFLTRVLIRHRWKLKTVVFLHRCLTSAVLFLFGLKVAEPSPLACTIKVLRS